jgi:tRNA G18 (ribose-2'-O)-methylase SpoU
VSPTRITDALDPRVAAFGDVREPELVRSRGLFVAESRRVVERLLATGRYRVRSAFLSDAAFAALGARIPAGAECFVASEAVLSRVAGYRVHHGCIALVERPPAREVEEIARGARRGLLVALEDAGNPENVGGVFRNAQAFGADGVVLSPRGADPLYRKSVRVSTGAALVVPFARAREWPGALE